MKPWLSPWRRGAVIDACSRCTRRCVASTFVDDLCADCAARPVKPAAAEAAQLEMAVGP